LTHPEVSNYISISPRYDLLGPTQLPTEAKAQAPPSLFAYSSSIRSSYSLSAAISASVFVWVAPLEVLLALSLTPLLYLEFDAASPEVTLSDVEELKGVSVVCVVGADISSFRALSLIEIFLLEANSYGDEGR
jgi:hypothetical protein